MTNASVETFSLYLTRWGQTVTPQRIRELSEGVLDRRRVTQILKGKGIAVRCVEPTSRSLVQLELPVLVELHNGGLSILERVGERAVRLREGRGESREVAVSKLHEEVACAFERKARIGDARAFLPALRQTLAGRPGELALGILPIIGLLAAGMLTPWLTRMAISGALEERAPSLLMSVVIALTAAALLRAWLEWLQARVTMSLETRLVRAGISLTFGRILRLPFQRLHERPFAEQLSTVSSAELVSRSATTLVAAPLVDVLTFLAYGAALCTHGTLLGIVVVLGTVLALLVAYGLTVWRARADDRAVIAAGVSRSRLHELILGIATVKTEHAEQPAFLRWFGALQRERRSCLGRDLRDAWCALWILLVESGLRAFVLGYGAFAVLDGSMGMAHFVYINMLSEGLLASLDHGAHLLQGVTTLRGHTRRVDALLSTESSTASRESGARSARATDDASRGGICMSDVWFRHAPDQPWVLQGYDLTLAPGEHLTLRAASGAGKTTTLRLLAGLYTPERGTVTVHGRNPALSRAGIAYFPQQTQLFAGSLRENLELLSGASLDAVCQAAERSGLLAWVHTLPMGLDTVVVAGGCNLSGGQRQWLLLTAACASAASVLLLDEPMSQLDPLVRGRLRLAELFAGRTTICVAHD